MPVTIPFLEHKAYQLRVASLEATTAAGSGHPTSCLSAADIVAAIFFYAMHYDVRDPHNLGNDRFILSKGHAAPLLYAAWYAAGVINKQELMTLRQFNSLLEGHPTPRFPYVEAATGSLGQGLSIGLGITLAARQDKRDMHIYVLIGDSESSEGSIWEAAAVAAYYKADHLIAFLDVNRLGQSSATMEAHNLEEHRAKWAAFGWHTLMIDGHDMKAIVQALDTARAVKGKPTIIIARTYKGYGLDDKIEDYQGFHGKVFKKEELSKLLQALKDRFPTAAAFDESEKPTIKIDSEAVPKLPLPVVHQLAEPSYKKDELIATRKAYGQALVALGSAAPRLVVLDAEVKNSTYAELFEEKFPERFVQCFVAEQNMMGMASGFATQGFLPFSSTFASFISRAYDQLRMSAISRLSLRVVGSHAGVSIGEDGPSQMGLEDIALMRSLPDSVVLYPCDAVSAYKLTHLMAGYNDGISYLRTTRGATPVIYDNQTTFALGGGTILRHTDNDQACIIAAGITVFEALKAHDELARQGIHVAVVDCYSIKPLPVDLLLRVIEKSQHRVITVEDHYPQGGLGEAVAAELCDERIAMIRLAVNKLPRSGTASELMVFVDIDAAAIVRAIHRLQAMSLESK
jgi:transketolase